MENKFFERLQKYFLNVIEVLRAEAKPASIFPNTTDIGMSREQVYMKFLQQHLPSKCNIFFGGFLFGEDGSESKQIDIIITADTTPKFNFYNNDNCKGKSFSPVDGTLGVASIKSILNKEQLEDALIGIASIPKNTSLLGKMTPFKEIKNYDDWPYKIIYASDGISIETLYSHLNNFYSQNPNIPLGRRPNIIHVAGKYMIFRAVSGNDKIYDSQTEIFLPLNIGQFYYQAETNYDLQAITIVLSNLQQNSIASTCITHDYDYITNRAIGIHNPIPK